MLPAIAARRGGGTAVRAAPSVRRRAGRTGRWHRRRTRIISTAGPGCGGGVQRRGPRWCCSGGVSGSAWRRCGEVLGLHGLVVVKGDQGGVLDKVWGRGKLTGDDLKWAALSGHHHAEFGMVQSVPKPA